MSILTLIIMIISTLLFVQSISSLALMLYSWESPERLQDGKAPTTFRPPSLSFSVLLPARHEEKVIYQTIERVCRANYLAELVEIIVICHSDDTATIAEAERAIRDLDPINNAAGSCRVRLATFSQGPINKAHGLNVGLRSTTHQVVTVFDAEDDIDLDIFNVINTIMLNEEVKIVQAGVQLMNFGDHWFSLHNCMEYFFWFKCRLHFHARVGMIPLGGNTIFIQRELLERIGGWDEQCLTEDAEIGLRLSALGVPIRVVYDAKHVTREETPTTVAAFVRQRTRWQQGFLQVLKKGVWRSLPKLSQRILAVYTLCYPYFQALVVFLWPLMPVGIFLLKMPGSVTMFSFLPLYSLWLQFALTIIGIFLFAREYRLKVTFFHVLLLIITFIPFQWLLGISAVRGVYREWRGQNNWEKTSHLGAHRYVELPELSTKSGD